MDIEIRRMWQGGPLRQCSEKRPSNSWISYGSGGYAGSYVCDRCGETGDGVYRVAHARWWCGGCRKQK